MHNRNIQARFTVIVTGAVILGITLYYMRSATFGLACIGA
jgi:hypothetical protein